MVKLRRRLGRRAGGVGGAPAVRQAILKGRLLRVIRCLAPIKHGLNAAGLTKSLPRAPQPSYSPAPHFAPETVVHLMDGTARYLEGSQKVFAFHTLEAQTRGLTAPLRADKTVARVSAHSLEVWQQLGGPDFLQLAHASAVTGGEKTPRRVGTFVRLGL